MLLDTLETSINHLPD